MYANYLIDVGKLVYIVGDNQNTTQFKNLFQSPASMKYQVLFTYLFRQMIFYKCVQQLPSDTFKKDKNNEQRKGIIRKDWFHKILNKNPQMIIMVFNGTAELQGNQIANNFIENQVWQDRLKIMIKRINRVYDAMRSNNKEDVKLKVIVLISKHTFGGINLHEKITNFLKSYQKQLFIIQYQYYTKQISKVRNQWIYALQKNYDNKYRKIQKRFEQSFLQRKLGCMVKMAIVSEMLSKRDQKEKYLQAYKALRFKFVDVIRSVTILTHSQIRQLRAISDIMFLRFLKSLISANTPGDIIFKQTLDHMNFFKLKNLGFNQTHKYYYYEELLWRCTFIENFFEILYKNDFMENISSVNLCELLNQLITYLYALSVINPNIINQQKSLGGKFIQQRQESYIGLQVYKGAQVLQTDIIYTLMSDIISHKKDYLSKGIQLVTRYKSMNLFKKSQLLFLNVYLLRLYFQDNKFQNFLSIYDEIMKQQISRSNYFLLNQIFNQIQEQFKNINQQQKVMFYGASCLISDYFQNYTSLQSHLQHLLLSLKIHLDTIQKTHSLDLSENKKIQNLAQLNQLYKFNLKKNSSIASVACYIKNQFVYIEDQIRLKFDIKLNSVILAHGCKISFIFNHKNIRKQLSIPSGSSNFKDKLITINPLQYFTKDESLKLECIRIEINSAQNLFFIIPNNHISFIKHKQNKVFTKIKCPQIQINNPYSIYYINEVAKFQINIQKLEGFITEAKCSIKQEDSYGKTEVFIDFDQRINLTNSNYYQELVSKDKTINQFWLKCNKIGEKNLKLAFHFTVQKIIQNNHNNNNSTDLLSQQNFVSAQQNQNHHILKQHFHVTKEMKFTIKQLFQIKKVFYEFSNQDNKLLQNRNIPVDKKVLCILQLSSSQDVNIKEIGQHRNPKKIQYLKQIHKTNFPLQKSYKMKFNMIFHINTQFKDEIQLFLMSIYIKWWRKQLKIFSQPYQNLYLDNQTKINCYVNLLSVFLNTNDKFTVKKNEPSQLILTIKNHSQIKNHILIQVEGNATILRIGQKGKQTFVEPFGQTFLSFDILPILSGFIQIPQIKMYVDGIQRNINIQSGQSIKCI